MKHKPKDFAEPGIPMVARVTRYRGLSTRELAGHVGVSPSSIAEILRGKLPKLDVAIRIARHFEVYVEDLWGEQVK